MAFLIANFNGRGRRLIPWLMISLILVVALVATRQTEAGADPAPGPALWKVEGGEAELYLFGTFHLLPEGLDWQTPGMTQALAASDTLIVEADTSDDRGIKDLVEKYAFNPPGKTLRSYFTKHEVDTIDAGLAPWDMSVDSAARLKPWFVGLQVGMTAMLSLGFDPELGVEEVLMEEAARQSMALDYIETPADGLLALADHPDALQTKLLLAMIEDLATLEKTMGEMTLAWSTGDVDEVADILNGNMARTPELIEAVLYQRNRNWIAPLKDLLESDGHYFIAVGAGHLAGANSVVELLEAEGYKVVRQ